MLPLLTALLIRAALPFPDAHTRALTEPPSSFAVAAPADDRARFHALMAYAADEGLASKPFGTIVQALGERLKGAPYAAGVLDVPADETLLAPLDRFDCVLYVEAVLALARGVAEGDSTYDGYLARVEQQRYRGGRMDGYGSRLHYFSDWVRDGEARGLVVDMTEAAGGVPFAKRLDFMTKHRSSYPQLAHAARFAEITRAEADLAGATRFYIPKARVHRAYADLQAGDVLATTTDLAGLDVTHTGFAYDAGDGGIGFLHASPTGGVKVSPDLARYLAGNPRQTGVYVIRPVDPRG